MGSLSLTSKYFTLSMVDSMDLNPALPIETVGQTTLSMHECDESLPFPDETVCFHGFGEPSKIPSEDNMWKPVSEKSPLVLLEEDEAQVVVLMIFIASSYLPTVRSFLGLRHKLLYDYRVFYGPHFIYQNSK